MNKDNLTPEEIADEIAIRNMTRKHPKTAWGQKVYDRLFTKGSVKSIPFKTNSSLTIQ